MLALASACVRWHLRPVVVQAEGRPSRGAATAVIAAPTLKCSSQVSRPKPRPQPLSRRAVRAVAKTHHGTSSAVQSEVAAAQREARQVLQQHRHGTVGEQRGMLFEVHHKASFNIAAIQQGSSLRAERVEADGADIRIYDSAADPRVTLHTAQLKSSHTAAGRHLLNNPKYWGHQKVVLAGYETPTRVSQVSCGGVSSAPISDAAALSRALEDPAGHFQRMLLLE